jgi:acyl-CoA synthetase (NDP forming)/GNAT superfamily N-acetyltransferase
MSTTQDAGQVYALLSDGTTVEIRPATRDDFEAVKAMHEALSPDSNHMRFFNFSRLAGDTEARRICWDPTPGNVTLLALAEGTVAGCASYAGTAPGVAEVAFAVADNMHHRGIATLLLEHLVSWARSHQITTFTAQTLSENQAMLNVFADAGLPVDRQFADGIYDMTFPLPRDGMPAALDSTALDSTALDSTALDSYLTAVAEREGRAELASLRHVLAPESVVVIGASRRPGTIGRSILDNIAAGGYAGRVYVVNPRARQIRGERCLTSVLDLPEPADLAVIAVPAAAVLDVAEQCGQRGVLALVVITSGLDVAACADLLAVCRRHGMRLVGPDCFGVAVPGIGLDATFAASRPRPGLAGLVMQSGGLGFALMDQLSRLDIGISSFASVGHKLDVSSNDLLLWWEHDGVTKVAVLYTESFGNPRKFARTARRVGATMPVLTVHAGRSAADQALFEQAGVITTSGLGELIEATALLATQPVPAGCTVAIVSNVGSAGRLAADACTDRGLTVYRPHGPTRRRLRALARGPRPVGPSPVGTGPVDTGPFDTGTTVSEQDYRQCLELLAADDEVDAIIALVLPTGATGDLVSAIVHADVRIPLAAVLLNQPESVRLLARPAEQSRIPAYNYPEAAVGALARAAGYGAWRAQPRGRLLPDLPDINPERARTLAREFLRQAPAGGWLPAGAAADLLGSYGITVGDPAAGTGVIVRVTADRTFGPLVVLGIGGASSARLTPLTDTDAENLIRSVRPAPPRSEGHPAPPGPEGRPAAELRDLLLRVSRLADDLPEVTDLDLAGPDGTVVTNARIKLEHYEPQDPFLRKLS